MLVYHSIQYKLEYAYEISSFFYRSDYHISRHQIAIYRVRQNYGNAHFDLILELKRRKLKIYCSSLWPNNMQINSSIIYSIWPPFTFNNLLQSPLKGIAQGTQRTSWGIKAYLRCYLAFRFSRES